MSEPIMRDLCNERMHTHDERFSRDKERLDDHESRIKTTEEAVILLTSLQARQNDVNAEVETRLIKIENRPGAFWDKLLGAGIAAVISALISYFL